MKQVINKHSVLSVLVLWMALGGAGCQHSASTTRRAGAVVLGAAAGGVAGHAIGGGEPLATGAGAVLGAGLTHVALGRDPEVLQQGFDMGYIQGQSDAIKRQYFLRFAAEESSPNARGRVRLYKIPGPRQLPDGTQQSPHTLNIRVVE